MNNGLSHILVILLMIFSQFLSAERINSKWNLPEDKFLPRKRRKLSLIFLFLPKNKPIRWRAYWMHRIAQINLGIYILAVAAGRCVYGSFDFMTDSIFIFYVFYMILSEALLDFGTFIYVKFKTIQQRKR